MNYFEIKKNLYLVEQEVIKKDKLVKIVTNLIK